MAAADLDDILARTSSIWADLRGSRIFLTGGTGFFGCWLLESFVWAVDKLGLDSSVVVLTRDPERFRRKAPHLAFHPAVALHSGDVRVFAFPEGRFSHVIHAATESSAALNDRDPLLMLDTIVQGTRRTLDFAVSSGARKFLFTSSGAVYGPQPPELTHVPEDYPGAPDPMAVASAYGEGKRVAELLCAIYHKQHGLETKIARCFAFVGPHLPLNAHFAIGNFIGDALAGAPIALRGDGTPFRSYLYAADLAGWLWTILVNGESCRPYDVGSEHAVTIAQLAAMVSDILLGRCEVEILQSPTPGKPAERYVPSTARARAELGLLETVSLREAIVKTADWARAAEEGPNELT